ncbi:MAG: signal recognition particle protein [Acidobacteria bacterium]|nr:signal recognition particle protein [Acidobacteriota bacterium]
MIQARASPPPGGTVFQLLSSRFQELFRRLRGEGRIQERHIVQGMREMRRALLEADVHIRVVQTFLEAVERRLREERLEASWNPAGRWAAIAQAEMVRLLSAGEGPFRLDAGGPAAILLVGLQGAGKTATAAKLGRILRRGGRSPLLVPADTRRPAAREQLRRLAERAGVGFHDPGEGAVDPVAVCRAALADSRAGSGRVAVIDTAGRLHVDSALMEELQAIRDVARPDEVLFVADAMTGQDAVNSARAFCEAVGITGVVLAKLDGDARGGAALSIVAATGVPIRFFGTGEGVDDLEPFHPERMASRILGQGDLQGLAEKVESAVEAAPADPFDLEGVRRQLQRLRGAGPLQRLLEMLPAGIRPPDLSVSGDRAREALAILDSMTETERRRPEILNGSRRLRVARGSGVPIQTVNQFLRQFARARRVLPGLSPGKLPGFRTRAGRGTR